MSKKVIKIVLIILLIAIALEVVFVLVDKEKVKQNQEPVFTRVTNVYISDSPISGYEEYLGLGYKILKVKITENEYYTKMMPIWEESDLSLCSREHCFWESCVPGTKTGWQTGSCVSWEPYPAVFRNSGWH